MQHVAFVNDDELPEGHDWALVQDAGNLWFLIKQSRVTPAVLTDAWRTLATTASLPVPALVA